MIARFLKDSIIYTLSTILSKGLGILLMPMYTKILSPQDFGVFDLFIVFGSIISFTVALEISQAVARFTPSIDSQNLKTSYVSTAFWFTLGMYAIFLITSFMLAEEISYSLLNLNSYTNVFQIAIIYISLTGIFYFLQNQLRFEGNSKGYAILSIIFSITNIILTFVFGIIMELGLNGIFLAMTLSSGISILVASFFIKNLIKIQFNTNLLKKMLTFSMPLVPSSIAVFFSMYIDRYMLNHFLGLEAVGIYSVAAKFALIMSLAMTGFQMAITPLIYQKHNDPDTPYNLSRIFRYFTASSLILFLAVSIFSEEIINLLTSPDYHEAFTLIPFLALAFLLSNMYVFMPGIAIKKKTHLFVIINIISAASNIILNFLFIPYWGLVGAALATTVSYFLAFLLYTYFSQKYYFVRHKWLSIALAFLVSIAFIMIANLVNLPFWQMLFIKPILIILFLTLIFYTGILEKSELLFLKEKLKHKGN